MFTSRAEHRLLLREDNADLRLTPIGRRLGLVDDTRWRRFEAKREAIERERARLNACWVRPNTAPAAAVAALTGEPLRRPVRALELLARPQVTHRALTAIDGIGPPGAEQVPSVAAETAPAAADRTPAPAIDPAVAEQIEIQCRYAGYVDRQHAEIARQRSQEARTLPPDFDYDNVRGLSLEVLEKLRRVRPATVGQAARIPGVTPAAVSLLLIHLKRRSA
jgi:tRNA uridine 5-carboxymethylaminomethyl modification enzyme